MIDLVRRKKFIFGDSSQAYASVRKFAVYDNELIGLSGEGDAVYLSVGIPVYFTSMYVLTDGWAVAGRVY